MSEKELIQQIPHIVSNLRKGFESGKTLDLKWRKHQLTQVVKMCKENRKEICEAIAKDLGSIPELVNVNEVGSTIQEAQLALESLDEWVLPEPKNVPIMFRPASAYLHKEPYGVVCIISPWNYPFRLLTFPFVGALAAGNAVLLKPSEVSQNTSHIFKKLIPKYFDQDAVAIVEGGVAVSSAILQEKFDYIFYTGNTEVGKIVMKAAAQHLTPVTLELGGKSPVFVDKHANLNVTANRILSGKFTNAGQTCVAPDYLLVDNQVKDKLVALLKEKLIAWYGQDPKSSTSYSRIINERHTARLQSYLQETKDQVHFGGNVDVNSRYVDPTLVLDPSPDSKLMKEEIFGPILPILGVSGPKEAIDFINKRPKPLALYVFSQDKKVSDYVVSNTSSGGVTVNGTIFHIILPEMQFGGVGDSGMGQYNGESTFRTFTHFRGVLERATWIDPQLLYPPFDASKRRILDSAADGPPKLPQIIVRAISHPASLTLAILAAGVVYSKL